MNAASFNKKNGNNKKMETPDEKKHNNGNFKENQDSIISDDDKSNPKTKYKVEKLKAKDVEKDKLIKDLDDANIKIKNLSNEINDLKKKIDNLETENLEMSEVKDNLTKWNRNLTKEKETLSEEIKHFENEIRAVKDGKNKELNEARRDQRETERLLQNLESKIQELQVKITEYEEKLEIEEPSEKLSTAKASFRIDIYPRQGGDYQGKIENLLTRNKKPFIGFDQEAILGFISAQLRQIEPQKPEFIPAIEKETVPANEAELQKILIFPMDSEFPSYIVPPNRPFKVQLTVDSTKILKNNLPLIYDLAIYAKPLGKKRELLSQTQNTINQADVFNIEVSAKSLLPGTYHLEAAMVLELPNRKSTPYSIIIRSGLFHVR